ncbi:MAG TPA: hypothetical protein VJ226_09315 [Bradyrhizobium sp.]|nr:hypothetical protein [Bradyrhizobium sp.]
MSAYTIYPPHGNNPNPVVVRNSDGSTVGPDDQQYIAWLAAGNTPNLGVWPLQTLIDIADLWARLTPTEQSNVQFAWVLAPAIIRQLVVFNTIRTIDLTSASVINWVQLLVDTFCITSARKTVILTPQST